MPGVDLPLFRDVCAQAPHANLDYGKKWQDLPDQMRKVADTNLLFAPGGGVYRDVNMSMRTGAPPSGAGQHQGHVAGR